MQCFLDSKFAEDGSRAVGKRDPSPDHVYLRFVIVRRRKLDPWYIIVMLLIIDLISLCRIRKDIYFRFGKRSQVQDFAAEGSRAVEKRDPSPDHVFLRYVIDNYFTLQYNRGYTFQIWEKKSTTGEVISNRCPSPSS